MRRSLPLAAVASALALSTGKAPTAPPEDGKQRGIAIYKESGHPCACPFDLKRNGEPCGTRSAHDKPNGASPVCFANEVTPELERDFGTNVQAALRERCHSRSK